MIPRSLSKLWWQRFYRRNARPWEELERFPRLSAAGQRRELARRLHAQIRYFGTRDDALPEWREAARIQDPEELWRMWPSLPVTGRATLQNRFPAGEIARRYGLEGAVNGTGGSTGEPLRFFHDTGMQRAALAGAAYTAQRMGWRPGMPLVIVWGSDRDIQKATRPIERVQSLLRNEVLLAGYRLTEETVDRVVEAVRRHAPVAIYGFTSMLEYVARRVCERGDRIPAGAVRTAWNGGEMLFPEQGAVFERAFGVPLLNRYGGRELSAMACQFTPGGPLEVLRPWLFLEILDEHGRPAAPGEPGRLIWTSTVCRGTPFLRYEIGDLGRFAASGCDESGIRAIAGLDGRIASLLELPDGVKINNIFWNHLFKEYSEVRQFQVVLRKNGELELRLKGPGFAPEREAAVRRTLASFLRTVPFRLCWVQEIPRTSQGKLVQVIREP